MITRFADEHAFLSNFYPAPVVLDCVTYPTVEHAYQAAKTLDLDQRMTVARMRTPGAAKRVGRTLTLQGDWETVRLAIMEDLLRQKFSAPDLAELLRRTAYQPLVEGNTWGDRFWGRFDGEGENHLGRLLMHIRAEIR